MKLFSVLQDALLARSSLLVQLTKHSTRNVPNSRSKLSVSSDSQHKLPHIISLESLRYVAGHVRDHPLCAVQAACYHSDVRKRKSLTLKRSHQLRKRPFSRLPARRRDQLKAASIAVDHKVWTLRLAHENSYLSWSRNAAICAGIAATVRVFHTQGVNPLPSVGSDALITGFADLGLVFILYGSCHHLYQAYLLRRTLHLRSIEFFWVCAYTTAIGLLYCFLIQANFGIFSI